MYVDVAYIKQKGKSYKRVLLRENFRENGKVKHRTIANLSRCSEQEIQVIKLVLKHKGDLSKLGSLKGRVKSKQGRSVGAIVLLKALADRLHITKALGNSVMGKLALWQVMARAIDQDSRLSAVRLAGQHAVCDLLNLNSPTTTVRNFGATYCTLKIVKPQYIVLDLNKCRCRANNQLTCTASLQVYL